MTTFLTAEPQLYVRDIDVAEEFYTPWGARTFIVRDPDGNLVLFAGQDS